MRIFFAAILVVVLSLLDMGVAHAGRDGTKCGGNDSTVYPGCDQGAAFADCKTSLTKKLAQVPGSTPSYNCEHFPGANNSGAYRCEVRDGLGSHWCGPTSGAPFYNYSGQCSARKNEVVQVNMNTEGAPPASKCMNGCKFTGDDVNQCFLVQADTGVPASRVGWNCVYPNYAATGDTCSDENPPPPPPDPPKKCEWNQTRLPNGTCADRGDCPLGQHKVGAKCESDGACPSGKIKAPDSSCVDEGCAAGQAKAKDGTCKKDDDGDGKPNDGEDTGKFSGGDDCKTPPQCSGDNIMCGQARIQWRIDCNTRRNDVISGGNDCSSAPACSGEKCSAVEYSSLIQQWRTACATEKLSRGTTTGGGDQPGWTKVTGMNQDPGQGSSTADTKVFTERTVDATDVNTTPIVGGGGSCPGFPVSGGGSGWTSEALGMIASPPVQWCDTIKMMHDIILLFALIAVIYINVKG